MGIVGAHPETGVRIEMERPRDEGPPWQYRGEAVTPSERFEVTVTVTAQGEVAVVAPPEVPGALTEKTRLVMRTVWKHAQADEVPPPRRIARWHA
jgi:hypothetical protein